MELKKHVLSSCNNRSLEAEMEVEVALGWRPQYYILISVLKEHLLSEVNGGWGKGRIGSLGLRDVNYYI